MEIWLTHTQSSSRGYPSIWRNMLNLSLFYLLRWEKMERAQKTIGNCFFSVLFQGLGPYWTADVFLNQVMKCISVTMVNTMRKNPLAFVPLGLQGVEMPLSPMSSWKLMVALYRSWSNWMYWTSMKKGSGVVARYNQTSSSLGRQLGTWFACKCAGVGWSWIWLILRKSYQGPAKIDASWCGVLNESLWVTVPVSTTKYLTYSDADHHVYKRWPTHSDLM